MDNKNKKEVKMDEKNRETSSRRIEQGFIDLWMAINSLEDLITEIDNGNMPKVRKEPEIFTLSSISELVKETPKMLKEIAERIRNQSGKLRDLIL